MGEERFREQMGVLRDALREHLEARRRGVEVAPDGVGGVGARGVRATTAAKLHVVQRRLVAASVSAAADALAGRAGARGGGDGGVVVGGGAREAAAGDASDDGSRDGGQD